MTLCTLLQFFFPLLSSPPPPFLPFILSSSLLPSLSLYYNTFIYCTGYLVGPYNLAADVIRFWEFFLTYLGDIFSPPISPLLFLWKPYYLDIEPQGLILLFFTFPSYFSIGHFLLFYSIHLHPELQFLLLNFYIAAVIFSIPKFFIS